MVELHPPRIIKYGTDKAARIAIGRLRDGKTALGAVLKAIEMIEYQKEAILISLTRFILWRFPEMRTFAHYPFLKLLI